MKSWILSNLSKLESYFFVEEKSRKNLALWSIVYMIFLALYVCFWISFSDTSQYLTYFLFLFLAGCVSVNSSLLLRGTLIVLLVLAGPIINTLLYNVDSKFIRIGVLVVMAIIILFIVGKSLVKISKLLIVLNMVFCLSLIPTYYLTKFQYNTKEKPPIADIISEKDKERDIYIILLDAFPSEEILWEYFGIKSNLQIFLNSNGFAKVDHITKYNFTDQSLPNLFSGTTFVGGAKYRIKDIDLMRELVPGKYLQQYANKFDYDLTVNSLLLDQDNNHTKLYFGRGSDFNIYLFPILNRILSYLHLFENSKDLDEQLHKTMNDLRKNLSGHHKKLAFFHFLTFHGLHYDTDSKTQTNLELKKADSIGIETVKMIIKEKPNTKIIVISDHGIRYPVIKNEDTYKGILYIKN